MYEFTEEEVKEILNEKLSEIKYIIKTNIEHTLLFFILGCFFLYISPFYSNISTLQIVAVLNGCSLLLIGLIFLTKVIKDKRLKQDIKLLIALSNGKSKNKIEVKEIFVSKIITKNLKLYVVTDDKEYNLTTPYVPEYILEKEVNALFLNEHIIDFFYF